MNDIGNDNREIMVQLDNEFLYEEIVEAKKLWPVFRIVRISTKYSPSNEDVDRVNLTIQRKLIHWMSDNNINR